MSFKNYESDWELSCDCVLIRHDKKEPEKKPDYDKKPEPPKKHECNCCDWFCNPCCHCCCKYEDKKEPEKKPDCEKKPEPPKTEYLPFCFKVFVEPTCCETYKFYK